MVSINDFYDCKHMRNEKLHETFNKKFQSILTKFESLSKSNAYKKIQKTNFLKIEQNEDKILNLLNKLTNKNYETIQQKIALKISTSNAVEYVNQILQYVSKSNVSPEYLWLIIKTIYNNEELSKLIREDIVLIIKEYISTFMKLYDTKRSNSCEVEGYLEFLERNQANTTVFSNMKMICEILNDKGAQLLSLNYDMNIIFNILMDRLYQMIYDESNNENSIYVILECIHIIIPSKQIQNNPYAYKRFLNYFSNETLQKKLKNKLRFKLYDIIDYLNQNESKRFNHK